MPSEIDKMGDSAHRLASEMERSNKAAEGFSSIFKSVLIAGTGFELVKSTVVKIVENTRHWKGLQDTLSAQNLSRYALTKREMDLNNELHNINRRMAHLSGREAELAGTKKRFLEAQLDVLKKQRVVAEELERIGTARLAVMGMMVTAGTTMWFNARQFNQSLIEANSSWRHRNKLISDTLMTQTQLGIGFDQITQSAAALVHYGMDTEATFTTNLRLVSQMEQGLGVAMGHSAQLASIVERQLKGSFESVSHTIAQIVDDTALAGEEAVRLATTISTALGRLRPGLSAATLPEVVRLVGRYESALKEVGGQSGAFQQLLTQLTTPEGIAGAGALGVSPEFLATAGGVQNVMDRFAKYGEMLVGQSQGWERQMRLQALGQIFNVSADQANQMLLAIQRANEQQMGQISVQERWKQQLAATNSGINRLGNSLMGLLQGAMYPVVFAVGALANKLADAVQWVLKSKEVVYTAGALLLLGTGALAVSMWGLTKAIWQTVAASAAAQAVMTRHAAITGGTSLLTSLAPTAKFMSKLGRWGTLMSNVVMPPSNPASALGWLNRLPSIITMSLARAPMTGAGWLTPVMYVLRGVGSILSSSLLLWATPLVFAGTMLTKIYNVNKQAREDNLAAQKIYLSKQEAFESQRRAQLYSAARYGSSSDAVAKIYAGLAQESSTKFLDIADLAERKKAQMAWLEQEREKAAADVEKAAITRTMFTPLTERTPEDQSYRDEMKTVNQKLLKVNENQAAILETRKRQEQERRQEEADERAKLKWYMPSFYADFYSRIGE